MVVGFLGLWAYSFANSNVHSQLAEQQIVFPANAAFAAAKPGTEITPGMIPYIEQYAGQQLVTGEQAKAYADHFIAVHLQEISDGLTYAQLSVKAMARQRVPPPTQPQKPRPRPDEQTKTSKGGPEPGCRLARARL